MLARLRDKLFGFSPDYTITPPSGPTCDGCGRDTGKPHLYRTPRTAWHCADCTGKAPQAPIG
ncbi:hypothetical protein [Streptomyces sp. CC224B]|uniref:hypothetical protein n=1 Tax=Streptomyces sp. CC224B TaxID=3044571 RepID=UPI0024A922F9|nr:hypothetical protein [Streptomyces sp. CC224B]